MMCGASFLGLIAPFPAITLQEEEEESMPEVPLYNTHRFENVQDESWHTKISYPFAEMFHGHVADVSLCRSLRI